MLDQYSNVPAITDPYQFYPQPSFEYSTNAGAFIPANSNPKKHIFNAPPKRSNALFIKNLPYNLTSDEFLKIFSQFGDIASISLHIQNRGIAFITYYDLRAAEAAKNNLQGFNVHGRFPAIDYSYKPPNYSKIDPREFSSLIKVNPITNSSFSKEDLQNNFSKFGEINEIKEYNENINNNSKADHISFLVLFYDSRCAHKACAEGFVEINGVKCQCEVFVEKDNSVVYNMQPPSKYQNYQNVKNYDRFSSGQLTPQNSYVSSSPHYQPIVSATPSGMSNIYQPPSPPVPPANQYPYQYGNMTPPYYSQQQPLPQKNSPIAYNQPVTNGMIPNVPPQQQSPINQQNQTQDPEKLKATLMKLKTLLHK